MTSGLREIGVGVIGLGLMGRVHVEAYRAANSAGNACRLVAVFDRDPARASGRTDAGGNLQRGGSTQLFDPKLVRATADIDQVLHDPAVELVSVCTPTESHVEIALRALAAGKNVLVEKPVSLDAGEIERLDLAARRAERLCMPAMCMRFWPGWSWLADAIADQRFGSVRSASLQRCASRPSWGQGFYADSARSGGALFDLHIHDADLVHAWFGAPVSLHSFGTIDHVTTSYVFQDGPTHVVAEGGWDHADGFPFRMRYVVAFERATAEFDSRRAAPLEIAREGAIENIALEPGTGYDGEIRHALDLVRARRTDARATLSESAAVTRMLHKERESLAVTKNS